MPTVEEYRTSLEKELEENGKDVELVRSPLWDRMKEIFRLRREMLMSMVMANEDDSAARTNRLKGRFQEAEYFFAYADGLQEEGVDILKRLNELDEHNMETELEEKEGGL